MTLNDLRRAAIKRQMRFHFKLSNSMTCVVDERGVARIPGSNGPLDVNLEQELAAAATFGRQEARSTSVLQCSRHELAALLGPAGSGTEAELEE